MRCVSRLPPLGQDAAAPGLALVLGCPAGYARCSLAGKGTRGYLACSLPNRNRIMMAFLVCQTYTRGLRPGFLVPSYNAAVQGPGPAPRQAGARGWRGPA